MAKNFYIAVFTSEITGMPHSTRAFYTSESTCVDEAVSEIKIMLAEDEGNGSPDDVDWDAVKRDLLEWGLAKVLGITACISIIQPDFG